MLVIILLSFSDLPGRLDKALDFAHLCVLLPIIMTWLFSHSHVSSACFVRYEICIMSS